MKKILLILITTILFSCQNYVKNMHSQISNEEEAKKLGVTPSQIMAEKKRRFDARPIKDPITFSITPEGSLEPKSQREYKTVKRRYTVDDLVDDSPGASLWANYHSSANLFATSRRKQPGDIVVINVNQQLKEDISRELRKRFPLASLVPPTPAPAIQDPNAPQKAPATISIPTPQPAKKKEEDKEIAVFIFDKISSRVAQEINDQHIILKGRKEVYFRNKKRTIEITALTKRERITNKDEVMSDDVLETQIKTLR